MQPDLLPAMVIFVRVVELDGFSAAAREMNLSKSAVSKQVSRLEDRLGVRLLNRTTRKLSLTEAGETYFEGCRRVLDEAELADLAVSRLAEEPRGQLKVNASMSFGIAHLAPALGIFLANYPELSVNLSLEDRVIDLVEEGYDLALRIGALDDSSLVARRICAMRSVICASPAYIEKHGAPEHPDDLVNHSCINYTYTRDPGVWLFKKGDETRRIRTSARLSINNGDAIMQAAQSGLGICVEPTFIAGEALRQGKLVRLLPDWELGVDYAMYAVYPARRNLPPKVRVFVDFLINHFGPNPYWDEGIVK
ncbi:LysR family transcriptional regulator [Rhodovibrionaceae bacterium A322]